MKKIIAFIAIFLFLLFSIRNISSISKVDSNLRISQDVYSKLDKLEDVRVYIKFKDAQAKQGIVKESNSWQMNTIKENVKSLIGKKNIKQDFGRKISAFINASDLELLRNNAGIESIELEKERKIFLQDSISVINATNAHNLTYKGLNLTGSGRTICIIDTGVNSSHPDLGGCYGNNNASSACKIVGGWDYCADNGASCLTEDAVPEDINGHGTHVSGIAAANGTIKGVAPEARIVMLKACNSSGSCFDGDIAASINWCIGNATTYNISVISLSLGGGLYTNYCNDDTLAGEINNAVGNNIPVTIASGNDGNTTAISAPACVQNATAIGSIRKNDDTLDFNRNFLVQLLAPGVSINSTCSSSDSSAQYCLKSGTSMSAPHAAGAIAILAQYINITRQVKTPAQIRAILNSTGKQIYDSSSNLNYSRINIFAALIALDNDAPNVTLISPANNSVLLKQNITFVCNAADLALKNMTFYLWNSSHSVLSAELGNTIDLANSSTRNLSGSAVSSAFTIRNLSAGDYKWNCFYSDYNNSIGYSPVNYTLSITSIETALSSPINNLFTSQNQTFTCNATFTSNLQNASFYIWNSSSSLVNLTNLSVSGTSSSSNFSFNFTYDAGYFWNCLYTDINNARAFSSSNFSITYDSIPPSINATSPLNASWQNIGRFNVTLNENGTCLYSLNNGELNYTLTSSNNRDFNAANLSLIDNQTYYVRYYCNDSVGNLNITNHFTFNTEMSAPNISLISPSNGYSASGSTLDVTFEYNVTDGLNISSCSLILNSVVTLTNTTIENKTSSHNFTRNLAATSYTWGINCTDLAGNIGSSSSRTLTITAPVSSSQSSGGGSGGGGGGGGGQTSSVYSPTSEQLSSGYKPELKKEDKVKITLFDEIYQNHTLIVESITTNSVNITLRSSPINFLLGIGQSIKFNLTSPKYYNLLIRLDEIKEESGKAKKALLTIQSIKEDIPQKDSDENKNISTKKEDKITAQPIREIPTENKFDNYRLKAIYASWAVFIFALAGLIVHWIDLRKEKKKEIKKQK